MENRNKKDIQAANLKSLRAIKASYQKVVRNMRHGPWIGCD